MIRVVAYLQTILDGKLIERHNGALVSVLEQWWPIKVIQDQKWQKLASKTISILFMFRKSFLRFVPKSMVTYLGMRLGIKRRASNQSCK